MTSSYFDAPVSEFQAVPTDEILGQPTKSHAHSLEHLQRNAWIAVIGIFKDVLAGRRAGNAFLEFFVARMGKRADAVLVSGNTVNVIEFKVGAKEFDQGAIDRVHDFALDLKKLRLGSHAPPVEPILVATKASRPPAPRAWAPDSVAEPGHLGTKGPRSGLP